MRTRKKHTVEYVKDGMEYFRRADGKLVSRPIDEYRDYRRSELDPAVNTQLDIARYYGDYPSKATIDSVIAMQKTSVEKAVNYVKYRYLGTVSYLDVFGQENEKRWEAEQHYRDAKEMYEKMEDMAAQLNEIQQLLFNIAVTINKKGKKVI